VRDPLWRGELAGYGDLLARRVGGARSSSASTRSAPPWTQLPPRGQRVATGGSRIALALTIVAHHAAFTLACALPAVYADGMKDRTTAAPKLWERTRQAAHAEIADTAMRLFIEQGFEATTIEQIASEVGISRRSFFRYFGTKEDVVLGDLVELGLTLKIALEARPANESPWAALRAAFEALPGSRYSAEKALNISRLIIDTPSLRARHIEKHLQWQELLVPNIEARLGLESGPIPDARAHAIIGAVLTCLDTATEIWTRQGGQGDLGELYDVALAAIRS